MKNTIVILTVFFSCNNCFAQISKSSVLLGGEFQIISTGSTSNGSASTYTNEDDLTQFTIAPMVGGFITPGFAMGGKIGLSLISESSKSTNTAYGNSSDEFESSATVISIGPFFRFYKFFGDKFAVINSIEPDLLIGSATGKHIYSNPSTPTAETKHKLSGFDFGYALNVSYLLKETIALEIKVLGVDYSTTNDVTTSDNNTSENKFHQFEVNSFFSAPQIGVLFYLGGKKK